MKTRAVASTMMAFSLAIFSAPTVGAQHDGHPTGINPSPAAMEGAKPHAHDHMMMANEPHHVLAMAHHSNLAVFAKALQDQTARGVALDADFSRAAVAEMRRSFDQMKQHHQEHMQKMSAMHAEMGGMMQKMETHQAELNTQLTALERELQLATPDKNKVSTLAASVNSHLDAMAKMKHDGMGSKPKAKM